MTTTTRPLLLVTLTVLAALLLAGCGVNRQLARDAEHVVAIVHDASDHCGRADRCAIDSPYQDLARELRRAGGPVKARAQSLEYGEEALLLRIHLIRSARHSIDLQTYIWAQDDSGWLVLDELIAAARRGVRVRILADQLFSLDNVQWLAQLAQTHVNFELRLYNPVFADAVIAPTGIAAAIFLRFQRLNQRMHNKLLLVDGDIGIAGGRNYQDRYFDWDDTFDYRDRDVLVIDPQSGYQMQASFDQFWQHHEATPLTRLNDVNRRIVTNAGRLTSLQPPANVNWPRIESLRGRATDADWVTANLFSALQPVQGVAYFSDFPGKVDADAHDALTTQIGEMILSAQGQILLQTPYLVFSRPARAIFRTLHSEQPGVEVIVSTNSLASTDAFYVYALSHKYKKRYIKQLHLQIHELKPFPGDAALLIPTLAQLHGGDPGGEYQRRGSAPLTEGGVRIGMHAKSLVIDEQTTMIGSHNFDPRSDNYNTESGFIIHDAAFAEKIAASIRRDIAPQNSWIIAKRPRRSLAGRMSNAIGDVSTALPVFDLWPFRYATSYELNPGCAPMKPDNPRFYDCHTDVGPFPGVDLPMKTIYTRIVTAFGAGALGVM